MATDICPPYAMPERIAPNLCCTPYRVLNVLVAACFRATPFASVEGEGKQKLGLTLRMRRGGAATNRCDQYEGKKLAIRIGSPQNRRDYSREEVTAN